MGKTQKMSSMSSFVNGLIAGAGVALALMSYGFLQYVTPLENIQGVSTTEIRIAIMLGGLVTAVAIAYEFYSKKEASKVSAQNEDIKKSENKADSKKDESLDE